MFFEIDFVKIAALAVRDETLAPRRCFFLRIANRFGLDGFRNRATRSKKDENETKNFHDLKGDTDQELGVKFLRAANHGATALAILAAKHDATKPLFSVFALLNRFWLGDYPITRRG